MSAAAQGCGGGWMLCHELTVPAPPTGASGMQLADRLAKPGTVLRELLGASFALKKQSGSRLPA